MDLEARRRRPQHEGDGFEEIADLEGRESARPRVAVVVVLLGLFGLRAYLSRQPAVAPAYGATAADAKVPRPMGQAHLLA